MEAKKTKLNALLDEAAEDYKVKKDGQPLPVRMAVEMLL